MTSYELKQQRRIDEIDIDTLLLEHKKTGAKVFLMPCEDENKVFAIGFRTPVDDSTGAAHILEHSVLCGSKKYPCKDPFIELAKGSLNTFLNAMTYPDKTVYPVASCNDKDFENLMDVYLDAVFNPNIHKEEKIFRQEGWHYELDEPDGELTYNGVVYNEMKGVYSSVDGIVDRAINQVLYEGHTYAQESGGDPDNIPDLTYEAFKDFHKKYYHPSNAYIILYGNCDMDRLLDKIDREYLSGYERISVGSEIPMPAKPAHRKDVTIEFPISDSEDENRTAILSVHNAVDCELDPVEYTAMQVLDYVLMVKPGAPVREALTEAGIGDDIDGGFIGGIRLPNFSIAARDARVDQKDEFLRVVKDTLIKQRDGGLDKMAVRAAINVFEFRSREADFGSMPRGLVYGLQSFDSWLYDADPAMHLGFECIYKELREKIDTGYYEKLIDKWLINNDHSAVITMKPVKGLAKIREDKLKAKLAGIKAAMSDEEIRSVIDETKALKLYQSEPSSREDILKIPLLKREDIRREIRPVKYEKQVSDGYDILHCDVFTSGIAYIKLIFDLKKIPAEDIPYAQMLAEVMGYIDTCKHSYAELSTLINMNSGGIGTGTDSFPVYYETNNSKLIISVNAKVLYDKIGFAFDMMNEILFESNFRDVKRIKDIIAEIRSKLKDFILDSGHQTALNRAGSAISIDRWFLDQTKGIAYYRMLESCDSEKLSEKLIEISHKLFTKDNLLVYVACDARGYECFKKHLKVNCYESTGPDEFILRLPEKKREAFTSPAMVNYVARCGNYMDHGYKYTGALAVLRVLLNYDYLWNNIRVLGGAYGCSAAFGTNGIMGFATYRDPNLQKSDEVFLRVSEYLRNYDADEREMTKAVIGAISGLDAPLTPMGKGLMGLSFYLGRLNDEDRQKVRDQILNVTPEDIRNLADMLEDTLADASVCAVANESRAKEEASYFDSITPLYSVIGDGSV